MRTLQRDQTGLITFSAGWADVASGNGLALPGVPFTYTRTSTGVYVFRFDSRLVPVVVTANGNASTSHSVTVFGAGPGTFAVQGLASNVAANTAGNWTCVARDTR